MGSPFAGPVWAPAGTITARRKAAAAPILKRRLAADMETSRDVIPANGRRALQRRHHWKRECIVVAWRTEITFFFRAMISGKEMHGPYQPRIRTWQVQPGRRRRASMMATRRLPCGVAGSG